MEAKRQARKQREQDAAAAAAAAKRPVGRPKGSGKKPVPAVLGPAAAAAPQQLVWVRIASAGHRPVCAGHRPVRAPAPARARACEQASRLDGGRDCLRAIALPSLCGGTLACTIGCQPLQCLRPQQIEWDAEPRRASKPLGKPWKLVLASSKSFEKTLGTRGLARKIFGA
jgi:hypothetical protein